MFKNLNCSKFDLQENCIDGKIGMTRFRLPINKLIQEQRKEKQLEWRRELEKQREDDELRFRSKSIF